ncbi:MAG TPA: STAS domain-containing protein [Vicinamibacterales bacterium]|nr:STAS domain-containing protein [Vicinamibacterales bacterium]
MQRALVGMTTPVLPLTDDIAAMPLIGALDSMRAAQAMEVALDYVARTNSRFLILDLSGVPVVDTQVAAAVLKTIQAVGLIGGTCIVSGIQPAVASTMVELGIDMTGVQTRSTLKAGLQTALAMVKT